MLLVLLEEAERMCEGECAKARARWREALRRGGGRGRGVRAGECARKRTNLAVMLVVMLPRAHAAEQKKAAARPPFDPSHPPFSMRSNGWNVATPSYRGMTVVMLAATAPKRAQIVHMAGTKSIWSHAAVSLREYREKSPICRGKDEVSVRAVRAARAMTEMMRVEREGGRRTLQAMAVEGVRGSKSAREQGERRRGAEGRGAEGGKGVTHSTRYPCTL